MHSDERNEPDAEQTDEGQVDQERPTRKEPAHMPAGDNLTRNPLSSIADQVDQGEHPLTPPLPDPRIVARWLERRIGQGQLIYATGMTAQEQKYKTLPVGYTPEIELFLQGDRYHIYGSRLRLTDGTTNLVCFDLDEPCQAEQAPLYLQQLTAGGAQPLFWHRQGDKGHLEVYFDTAVDPQVAYQWLLSLCPSLASIPECFPVKHTDNRTNHPLSWPLFQRLGDHVFECAVSAWFAGGLVTLPGYTSDPAGVTGLIERALTPAVLCASFVSSVEAGTPMGDRGALLEKPEGETPVSGQSTDRAKVIIADFNRSHTWEDVAGLCGGMSGDRFCAVWRGEDTPSVVIDRSREYACDYGRVGEYPKKLDKYEVWCLTRGIDKRKDLAGRLAAYRSEQESATIGTEETMSVEHTDEEASAPSSLEEETGASGEEGAGVWEPSEATSDLAEVVGPYPPPDRACLVCGQWAWIWNGECYECGSGDPVHEERLQQDWIWAKLPPTEQREEHG